MKHIYVRSVFFMLSFLLILSTRATPLFYRSNYPTTPLANEIKRGKNCDFFINVSGSAGSTTEGRDSTKAKVNFPNIYGNFNMNKVGGNTNLTANLIAAPASDPNNHYVKLQNLTPLTGTNNFGHLSFSGKLKHFEVNFNLSRFFRDNLFIELNIPVRKLEVKDTAYTDLTPAAGTNGALNQANANWTNFLASFDDILGLYSLTKTDVKQTGIGDIELIFGAAHKSRTFDNLEIVCRGGLTIGSGKKKDEDKVFSIANGYDGHSGVTGDLTFLFSPFKSFTLELGGGGTTFFNKTKDLRMVTDTQQSGFIKLAKGKAERSLGSVWHFESSLIFKPIDKGCSVTLGYSFQGQGTTQLFPENQTTFNVTTANSDAFLKRWHMHNLNISATASGRCREGKRKNWYAQFFYSRPFKGEYVANLDTFGGCVGMGITWKF